MYIEHVFMYMHLETVIACLLGQTLNNIVYYMV